MTTQGSEKQLCLFVQIQVAPENANAFLEALREPWEGCINEPENLLFDVFQDPQTPGRFRFVEIWTKDRQWFETVQLKKSYYKRYLEITVPMWTGERNLEYFERQPGFSAYTEKYLADSRKVGK